MTKRRQPETIVEDAYIRTLRNYVAGAAEIATFADKQGLRGEVLAPSYDSIANEDFTDEEFDSYEQIGDERAEQTFQNALKHLVKQASYKIAFRAPRNLTWY